MIESLIDLGCNFTGRGHGLLELLCCNLVQEAAKLCRSLPEKHFFDIHNGCPILPHLINYFYHRSLNIATHTLDHRLEIGRFCIKN